MFLINFFKKHSINLIEYLTYFVKTYWSIVIFYSVVGLIFFALNAIFPDLHPRIKDIFSRIAEVFLLAGPLGSLATFILDDNMTMIYNARELNLKGIYQHKREKKVQQVMKDILLEATGTIERGDDIVVRLVSVVGKQFLHPNGSFHQQIVLLLECLQKHEKYRSSQLRVMLLDPFSKLAFSRAESEEFRETSDQLEPDKFVDATWNSLLFIDSRISFVQVLRLCATYPQNIEVRFVEYLPIFMLSTGAQSVISYTTFSATKKTSGDWYGKMPVYHHVGYPEFKGEAINHFDYLWLKGKSLHQFISDLKRPDLASYLPEENRSKVLELAKIFLEEMGK